MVLSVGSLIEVSTSALESVLDSVRSRLDGLQDRVAELEQSTVGHDDVMDEDAVENLIEQALDGKDYAYSTDILDGDDVERIVKDTVVGMDLYDQVSDRVYDMVKDVVREDLDEKDFADNDHDHDGSYADVNDFNELDSRVTEVEQTLESAQQRLTVLEDGNTNAQGEVNFHDMAARIEALEADRSEHLRLIQELQESSSGATRFFKLAVQMLDIVRGER